MLLQGLGRCACQILCRTTAAHLTQARGGCSLGHLTQARGGCSLLKAGPSPHDGPTAQIIDTSCAKDLQAYPRRASNVHFGGRPVAPALRWGWSLSGAGQLWRLPHAHVTVADPIAMKVGMQLGLCAGCQMHLLHMCSAAVVAAADTQRAAATEGFCRLL